ncbi:MAG: hypothetical protein AAGK78_04780, partial [Planctomycetota bacterium]
MQPDTQSDAQIEVRNAALGPKRRRWWSGPKRAVVRSRRAHGVVLLFVVVLLTLLAVIGSAYLISSRVSAGNVGPAERGELDAFGTLAAKRTEDYVASTARAAQLQLILDLFESERVLANPGVAAPSTVRLWPDDTTKIWKPAVGVADARFGNNAGSGDSPADVPIIDSYYEYGSRLRENSNVLGLAPVPPGVWEEYDTLGMQFGRVPTNFTGTGGVARFPFYNIDALGGTDPHLAARLPDINDVPALPPGTLPTQAIDNDRVTWSWISAPLTGLPNLRVDNLFADPLRNVNFVNGDLTAQITGLNTTGGSAPVSLNFDLDADPGSPLTFDSRDHWRANLGVTVRTQEYPSPEEESNVSGGDVQFWNDRVRVYPALYRDEVVVAGEANGIVGPNELIFTAADADGDGIADAGLVPIVQRIIDDAGDPIPVGAPARYFDDSTGLTYFVAVRIVDNNAAINVNTALTNAADIILSGTTDDLSEVNLEVLKNRGNSNGIDTDIAAGVLPNYGIW